MTVAVYNKENKEVGKTELPDEIFGMEWKPDLVHQVVVATEANRRQPVAHVKERGEVRGGGRKPWRQKGTGRARAGSIRSPIWTGGGVTFGPRKEKDYSKKINKKMKRSALFSVLSKKLEGEGIKVVDDFKIEDHKTKNLAQVLGAFFEKPTRVLLVPSEKNKNLYLASRNIQKTKVSAPSSLNIVDCLAAGSIIIEQGAVPELIETFLN